MSSKCFWVVLGAACAFPPTAIAGVDELGRFTTSIPIEVPAFYNITPRVELTYGSGELAGSGWSLGAGSIISRTSATRGTPRFSADDLFWLDGDELIPCASGSTSPSCTTAVSAFGSSAGFYSTRVERFWRIRFEAATGAWTVWNRDGTRREYFSGDGGLAYQLGRVTDTHGNRVEYRWSCQPGGGAPCALDAIRYGATASAAGVVIRMYREIRPDARIASTGLGMAYYGERLRSIAVWQHCSLVRAYRLRYQQSQETGASILTEVQQYGRDATVTASGEITPGPTAPLPATRLGTASLSAHGGWQLTTDVGSSSLLDVSAAPAHPLPSRYVTPAAAELWLQADAQGWMVGDELQFQPSGAFLGDFDGDGRAEVLAWGLRDGCATVTTKVWLQTPTGLGPLVGTRLGGGIKVSKKPCTANARVADVNGDGRDDVVFNVEGKLRVALGQANGVFTEGPSTAWSTTNENCRTGDVDGDGRDDLVCTDGVARRLRTYLATAGGWQVTEIATDGSSYPNLPDHVGLTLAVADVNADGMADVILARPNSGSTRVLIGISQGYGTYAFGEQTFPAIGDLTATDIDGDGRVDLVLSNKVLPWPWQTGTTTLYVALARKGDLGTRFQPQAPMVTPLLDITFADVNGDGRADIIGSWIINNISSYGLAIQLASPNGGFEAAGPAEAPCYTGGSYTMTLAGDLNGDGLADPLCIEVSGIDLRIIDRMSQARGADRHRWRRANTGGYGPTELTYVAFNNPGYTVYVVTGQRRYSFTVSPGGALSGLVEPAASRWMIMDVGSPSGRADGKDDLVLVENVAGVQRVTTLLSTGLGTFEVVQATPSGAPSTDPQNQDWLPVNLDRDGMTDLARLRSAGAFGVIVDTLRATGAGQYVAASSNVYFGASSQTAPMSDPSIRRFVPADLNGDGLTDFLHIEIGTTSPLIRALVARGDGAFDEVVSAGMSLRNSQRWHTADLNGDGITDLVHVASPSWSAWSYWGHPCLEIAVQAGNGRGGFERPAMRTVCLDVTNPLYNRLLEDSSSVVVSDLDGDGRAELLHVTHQTDANGGAHLVVTTLRATSGPWQVTPNEIPITYDLGDSWSWMPRFDAVAGEAGLSYVHPQAAMTLRWRRVRDELSTIDNGMGLTTTITREPYLGSRSYLPAGTVPWVVSWTTVSDAAYSPPVVDSVRYSYGGARWSDREQRLAGYELIGTTHDHTEIIQSFDIDDACGARLARSATYDLPILSLLGHSAYQYEPTSGPGPYRCLNRVTQRYACEGEPACRLAEQGTREYDAYGNAVHETAIADQALPSETIRPVYANVSDYLVDRAAYEYTFDPTESLGRAQHMRRFYYGSDNSARPPSAAGDLTATDDWDSQTGLYLRTQFVYDTRGNLTTKVSPAGKESYIEPNPTYSRFPYKICNEQLQCSVQTWDLVLGEISRVADPNGATTTWERDAHGRVTRVDQPGGIVARTAYLDTGTFTGPTGGRQRIRHELSDGSPGDGVLWSEDWYDGSGRTYLATREGGATVSTEYADGSNRPARISEVYPAGSSPSRWTRFTYDGLGRSTSVTNADSSQSRTRYKVDQVIFTDELGVERSRRFDGRGRVIEVVEPDYSGTATTRYTYDAQGRLNGIIDALGNATQLTLSSLDRLVASNDPDRGLRNFEYELDGELRQERDARHQSTTYVHDSLGRVTQRTDASSTGVVDRRVTWTYDDGALPHGASVGRLVRVDSQDITSVSTELWYDAAGRVARSWTCISGQCMAEGRAYDVAGRVQAIEYPNASGHIARPGSERVTYTYDTAGQLQRADSFNYNAAGQPELATLYAVLGYELDGRPRSIFYGNSVATQFDYDPARRWLDRLTVQNTFNEESLLRLAYSHDPVGRITRQTMEGRQTGSLEYDYDTTGRLWSVRASDGGRNEWFSYDPIGRLRWSARLGNVHYDDPTHVHAATSTDRGAGRQYDARGNASSVRDPNGRALDLTWTADDHVASIHDAGRGDTYRFAYDASGRRAEKRGPDGTSRYFSPLVEVDAGGRLVKYIMAGDRLLARNENGTHRYYHADVAHATRLVTDDFEGDFPVLNSYEYWASGEPYRTTESTDNDIEYSGARTDESLGLIAMGARVYDPLLSRFLSADSVLPDPYRPQSLDRYAYVENDPVNRWDPSGHMKIDVEYMMERKLMWRTFMAQIARGIDCSMFGAECEDWMTGASFIDAGRRDFYNGAFEFYSKEEWEEWDLRMSGGVGPGERSGAGAIGRFLLEAAQGTLDKGRHRESSHAGEVPEPEPSSEKDWLQWEEPLSPPPLVTTEQALSHDEMVVDLIGQYRAASRSDYEAWDRAREDYRLVSLKGGDLVLRDAEHFLFRYWLASTPTFGEVVWIPRPNPAGKGVGATSRDPWYLAPMNSLFMMNTHDVFYNELARPILEQLKPISPTTPSMYEWERNGYNYGFCAAGDCSRLMNVERSMEIMSPLQMPW